MPGPLYSSVQTHGNSNSDRLLVRLITGSFTDGSRCQLQMQSLIDPGMFVLPCIHSIVYVMALHGESFMLFGKASGLAFIIADQVLLKPVGFY